MSPTIERKGRIPAYNLARITVEPGEISDLVQRLLSTRKASSPKARMLLLSQQLDVSTWTIYRWLRGLNRPMSALLRTMYAMDARTAAQSKKAPETAEAPEVVSEA